MDLRDADLQQDGTEVELKLLLDSEADAERLRVWLDECAGPAELREQVNTYFDTADLRLRQARAMVRIRVDGKGVRATWKHRPQLRDGLMQVHEIEGPLPTEVAAAMRVAVPATLPTTLLPFAAALDDALGDPPEGVTGWTLHGLGALANRRLRYRVPRSALVPVDAALADGDALLFELDSSLGPAGEPRHELEIEDADVPALRPFIEALLDGLEVTFRPAEMSKYAWFLRGLEQGPAWLESEAEGVD